ncbi:MAG: hypothetical protein Q9226_005037 [Calogaya cf. arnoldii]
MATIAHCLFCFDVLSASLDRREHLSLKQVEDLWSRFQARLEEGGQRGPTDEEANDQGDGDDPDFEDGEEEDPLSESDHDLEDLSSDDDEEAPPAVAAQTPSALRLPTISRLQAPSPASASTSSIPSSVSDSSSRFGFEDSSSKTSSTTSIFSFGRRSKQPSPAPRREQYPLFVTWNTISARGHKSLRGCIGTFEAQELASGLENYALTAAFDDTRFSPIPSAELPTLANYITLLHTFTPCAHPLDWSLGTHGLRISFTYHGRRYGATYLPDVAVEQGWTKEETIVSLMRKAGWTGRSRDWSAVADLKAVRYEGKGEGCRWSKYRDWRDWVDSLVTEGVSKR